MDTQNPDSRFDWNRWLATVPGIPHDWGAKDAIAPPPPFAGEVWAGDGLRKAA